MAFRLQSAIAGAAKVASEKMRAFDEDYADTLKNTAANLAKEAADIRKTRMASVREYQKYGKRLQTNYGLSDAQVQTLLAGGVDQYKDFVDSIKNQQQIHVLSGEEGDFDARTAAANMFAGNIAQPDGILSVADQAQAYAAQQAPNTLDLEATAAGVAAGTRRGIFGVDQETVKAALQGTAGEFADLDTTGTVMSDTGLSVKGLGGLTADETIAARTAVANLKNIQAKTRGTEQQTKLVAANTAAAEIVNKTLPEKIQVEIDSGYVSNALKEQQIQGIQIDQDTAILNQEKLEAEIENYKTFGAENQQKALDLLDAKIFAANSPSTLEQLQATYLSQETNLRTEAASLEDTNPKKILLLGEAEKLKIRAAGVANMIKDSDATTQVDWSKGDPTSRFNAMLKTNLQNQNITGTLNPATGNFVFDFTTKRPAYITGFANTVSQYENMYGEAGVLGKNSSEENTTQLTNQIRAWSQEGNFLEPDMTDTNNDDIPDARINSDTTLPSNNFNFGLKTIPELARLQIGGNLVPGDIAVFESEDDDGNKVQITTMYSTQGEWISGVF